MGLSISEQCKILGVSRSGYYRWLDKQKKLEASAPKKEDNEMKIKLANAVMDCFAAMPFIGYKKMSELLQTKWYLNATEKRIRLLYNQLRLKGVKPKFKT